MTTEVILAFFIGIAFGFMINHIWIRALLRKIMSEAQNLPKKRESADWWKPEDYDEGEAYR